jgi:Fic family protein
MIKSMNKSKKFQHWDIKLPAPKWESDLPRKIIDLEKLREKRLNPESLDLFMEFKIIFQQLENWASARIEGNQTELLDALDPEPNEGAERSTDKQELRNLTDAINFVDDYCKNHKKITRAFILEVHKRVTRDLPIGKDQPGDETPGKLRIKNVKITKSKHIPPIGTKVSDYMDELVDFVNHDHNKQNYLLATAVFHHRFTWVHPFNNGNGRVVRLLTYAMLELMGYGVRRGQILNPTAVFYADRTRYYRSLQFADAGTNQGILKWADYFLGGLIDEIQKIDRLLDKAFMLEKLLFPVLKKAKEAKRIGDEEYTVLRFSLDQPGMTFVSGDINTALGQQKTPLERSRMIKRMREMGIINPAFRAKQRYVIELWSRIFMIFVIEVLEREGFVQQDIN